MDGPDHIETTTTLNSIHRLDHVSTSDQALNITYHDGSIIQEDPEFDDDFYINQDDDDDIIVSVPAISFAEEPDVSDSPFPNTITGTSQRLSHLRDTLDHHKPLSKRQKIENNTKHVNDLKNDAKLENEANDKSLGLLSKLHLHIWHEIFAHLDLSSLNTLRCTRKDWSIMLMDERIWTKSRKIHNKGLPKPAFGLREWEMWSLYTGTTCMSKECSHDDDNAPDIKIYWPFRIRCCKEGFLKGTVKEHDSLLESSVIPREIIHNLLIAIPHGYLNKDDGWISFSNSSDASPKKVKVYWREDMERIYERYEDARSMNAAEEWLKGLTSEGQRYKVDLDRMERWYEISKTGTSISSSAQHKNLNAHNAGHLKSTDPTNKGRQTKTSAENAALKGERRQSIVEKCAKLQPPLIGEILTNCPIFQAAVQIPRPMTEADWKLLLPKLQAQCVASEPSSIDLQDQKALIEKSNDPDDIRQSFVRYALDDIADDFVQSWPEELSPQSASRFAAYILIQTREKYYQQRDVRFSTHIKSQTSDKLHVGIDCPNLVLEDMKYVFDTKVKPKTASLRKELFLCFGCGAINSKMYAFESIIQHYASKHTTLMSMGTVVVHWQAEWPSTPPFYADPSKVSKIAHLRKSSKHPTTQAPIPQAQMPFASRFLTRTNSLPSSYNHNIHPQWFQSGLPLIPPQFPPLANHIFRTYEHPVHQPFPPYYPSIRINPGCAAPVVPAQQHLYPLFPIQQASFSPQQTLHSSTQISSSLAFPHHDIKCAPLPPPPLGIQRSQDISTQYCHTPKSNNPLTTSSNKERIIRQEQLKHLSSLMTQHWMKLSEFKELPVSIRVLVMINEAVGEYKRHYLQDHVSIQNLHEALRGEQSNLGFLKTISKLQCKMCPCSSKREFSLPLLLQHFESVHMFKSFTTATTTAAPLSGLTTGNSVNKIPFSKVDWWLDMVRLPDHDDETDELNTKLRRNQFWGFTQQDKHRLTCLAKVYPNLFQDCSGSSDSDNGGGRLVTSDANIYDKGRTRNSSGGRSSSNTNTKGIVGDKENVEEQFYSSRLSSEASLTAAEDFLNSLVD